MVYNNLFNEKKMEEFIELYDSNLVINSPNEDPVCDWIKKLNNNELEDEKKNYANFLVIILERLLGYKIEDIAYETDPGSEGRPVEFTFKKGEKEYVVVELKGTKTKDLNKRYNRSQSAIEQVTNYASIKEETQWAFVSNYNEFRLFNPNYREKYISFKFKSLTDPEVLKKFLLIFSKFSLIEEDIPQTLLRETRVIERELEDEFYQLFSETRLMLIKELECSSEDIDRVEAIRLAQLILNRYIFICFAEDLKLIPSETTADVLITPIEKKNLFEFTMWNRLNELFRFMDKGNEIRGIGSFNGGLFKENLKNLEIRDFIEDLHFYDDCYKKWKFEEKYDEMTNLLGEYKDTLNPIYKNLLVISSFDFESELSVNILGHIFENSIGDIEELKDQTKKRRKKEGVFYTPEYITDYICRNTIIPYLSHSGEVSTVHELISEYEQENNLEELDKKLKEIKIVDPACGSGAFLNKAVDILFEIHESLHYSMYADDTSLDQYFDSLESRRQIIINNIYGVDLNEESVEITKLSLFLKLATNSGINKGFKLPNLDNNIKCADSLVDDKNIMGEKAFRWKEEFKEIFDYGGFDIVVGNPPYVSSGKSANKKEYKDFLKRKYYSAYQKYDLYVLFIELSINLLKESGKLSFIVPFPLLNQDYGLKLRQKILENVKISEIFDLSNYKIFSDAEVRNIIINFEKSSLSKEELNENIIKIKKQNIDPTKNLCRDYSIIKQDIFNYTYQNMFRLELDDEKIYNLLNKILHKSNQNLEDVVFSSWGARGTPIKDFHLDSKINDYCKKLIKGINVNKFSVNYDGKWLLYDLEKLYRPSMIEFFESEKIMIKKVSGKEGLTAAYDDSNFYTDDSICCVSLKYNFKNVEESKLRKHKLVLDDDSIELSQKYDLKYLLAFINSNLINFYFKNMIGYDLNVYPTNILALPFIGLDKYDQEEFVLLVDSISGSNEKFYNEINSFQKWLKRTYEIELLSKKLENYYKLDFEEFLQEVKKKKVDITQRKTQDLLEKEFNASLEIIEPLQREIKETEYKINQLVYELYGLTDEEINIIEESLK